MKKAVFLFGLFLCGNLGFSQNEDDALRYSQTRFGGSARNTSMAGAMTAIGGDFSVVLSNPAGLARFMKSNFSGTLNIEYGKANANFYGNADSDQGVNANISNLSYVKAYKLNPNEWGDWYGVQLGMGVNRINNFNQRINYSGLADSSILHSFIVDANGTPDSLIYDRYPFGAGLAYDVFAIDPADGNQYTTDFNSGRALHNRSITRSGGMHEYSFAISGNYANTLFVGGSFNATKVNFQERFSHTETYTDTALFLRSINYTGNLETEGWGYSARVGLIYLPLPWLSVGLSAQLPTVYNLSDNYTNNMTAETDAGGKFVDPEFVPTGSYDYRLRTPFRGNISIGAVSKKIGMIGVEIEYVDYSSANLSDRRFSNAPYDFVNENFQIENLYKNTFNFKTGFELKLDPQFTARGGFAFYDTPFRDGIEGAQSPTTYFTGGLGYNQGKFYFDLATVLQRRNTTYYAYNPTLNGSEAALDFRNAQFTLTFGMRF